VVVRAPLLPVDAFPTGGVDPDRLDEEVRTALAVATPTLSDALDPGTPAARRAKVDRAVLRYLIRMSTRPTPFGLFAGVGLGRWDATTTLQIGAGPRPRRTRPDMAWLLRLVHALEAEPEVRRKLRVVANPAALQRAGRVLLAERAAIAGNGVAPAVSVRATGVVRRALHEARTPLPWRRLASCLQQRTEGATTAQVERLLDQLWEQTLLLTDLRPPLTVADPAAWVVQHVPDVPAAVAARRGLEAIVERAGTWDAGSGGDDDFRALVAAAAEIAPFDRSPFHVDTALPLDGAGVSPLVAEEAARAALALLRMTPAPAGPPHLAAYRRRFEHRYGPEREVPLLELLDPDLGLGPLPLSAPSSPTPGPGAGGAAGRSQFLVDLAVGALRDRVRVVTLDDDGLDRLGPLPKPDALPPSLDLVVAVAAASSAAVDAGDFRLVVAPAVGAMAAGRTLGRFADVVPGATEALSRLSRAEEDARPGPVRAELVYQPRSTRMGNVTVRPNVRTLELPIGVSSGREPESTIGADELLVGVRSGRFVLRWTRTDQEVEVTSTHMLNPQRAPALARFLSEVGRDGVASLHGFSWGPASTFPFLPRVELGRVVLCPARWRLRPVDVPGPVLGDLGRFRCWLDQWRERWDAPRRVQVGTADSRLLLDLADDDHVGELHHLVSRHRPAEPVTLHEALPDLDQAWVTDTAGRRYLTELVVPLMLRRPQPRPEDASSLPTPARRERTSSSARPLLAAERLRPPGSDWAFAKLYLGPDAEQRVLLDELRPFASRLLERGSAEQWFFLRYSDPDRHLRLRFSGRPDRLLAEVVPALCQWAGDLIERDLCSRFALDTYERELERFGGPEGTTACERFFAADSAAVVQLLARLDADRRSSPLATAVLSVDAILGGLGLAREERAEWCRRQVPSPAASGSDYRDFKGELRPLLADSGPRRRSADDVVREAVCGSLRSAANTLAVALGEAERSGRLSRPAGELWPSLVHLHLNRLGGPDRSFEHRVLGLLWRLQHGLVRTAAP
jgi:thiopeptide-type bacteriocin biosynthesis protein